MAGRIGASQEATNFPVMAVPSTEEMNIPNRGKGRGSCF